MAKKCEVIAIPEIPNEPQPEKVELACGRCEYLMVGDKGGRTTDLWCPNCQNFRDFTVTGELNG